MNARPAAENAIAPHLQPYLRASEIIDWQHPTIADLAPQLSENCETVAAIAQTCFTWVRDEIHHSVDYQMNPFTCRASDVLKHKTGYCLFNAV